MRMPTLRIKQVLLLSYRGVFSELFTGCISQHRRWRKAHALRGLAG